MSIKSDKWIRRMAREHRMIEPFAENQVREGVISYGVSSYGYDIRVADEFKIFTNINSTIVDPKRFDQQSFVDFKGPVCIVPPNSFALARTVEYFRIPRSILTICVGKSTYARCFRGDTRVALVDGTAPTLEEMARRADNGEVFWGYGVGLHGRIIMLLLEAPRYIGRDSLVEVDLDTGESIFCTHDHQFLARDGRTVEADQLRPGSSLMPLYRQVARGYEMLYQPLEGYMYPTHRLADEWNLRHDLYDELPETHRHHLDGDRRNNRPWNIARMDSAEHVRYHNQQSYGPDFDPDEHGAAIREALERLAQDPSWREQYSQAQRGKAVRFWHDDTYAESRGRALEQRQNPTFRRFPHIIRMFKGMPQYNNHKVAAIRELPGDHDVYCLTAPEAGNFALEAGVFVSNCGIIVNVTPFEPEWEGTATLEISNTTPLPAKIYANEGIAQVVFFEADEICETSYADKKGKYQAQWEITLPRI